MIIDNDLLNYDLYNLILKKNISIAIAGSGGKTTLMNYLANFFSKKYKVICTTSTHILKPEKYVDVSLSNESYHSNMKKCPYLTIGKLDTYRKLSIPNDDNIKWARNNSDIFIYEADGSRRLPLKFPKKTEPVILENTDIIFVVIGLSSLDKKIKDACYNYNDIENFNDENKIVDEELIAIILKSGFIYNDKLKCKKLVILLNQADNDKLIYRARKIYNMINVNNKKIIKLISSFKEEKTCIEN